MSCGCTTETFCEATPADAPIACTLDGLSFKERLVWIRDLRARALLGEAREDLTLTLTFDAQARTEVSELVRNEQECCRFLDFALAESDAAVRLTITVPERARGLAEEVFGYFVPTGTTRLAAAG